MTDSDGAGGFDGTPSESMQRVRDAASTVIQRGKETTNEAVARGAERASALGDSTASALRRAADEVDSDNRMIGSALRKGAETIERGVRSIQGGDVSRAVHELNGFARRQPALFLGGGLALGFVLARIGKTAIEEATGDAEAASAAPGGS